MILHFDQALVHALLTHSKAASARRTTSGQAKPAGPGLWLVGDEGVYLMSNGIPGLRVNAEENARNVVCYAREANPETLGREHADDAKRASFGGDDGVDFLAAADLLAALADSPIVAPLALDVTAESIAILLHRPAPPKRRKAGAP